MLVGTNKGAAKMPLHIISGEKVVTTSVYPPIPSRSFDWQAHYDNDEPNADGQMAAGHGPTEAAAIADLIDNYPPEERS